jgi:hypothetical protein
MTLVSRNSLSGLWTMKVPAGWVQQKCASGEPANALCTSMETAKAPWVEVWYNPNETGQRIAVTTCFQVQCGPSNDSAKPVVSLSFPVSSSFRISAWELGFSIAESGRFGSYPTDGVVSVAHMGFELAYPVVVVTVSLPAAEHAVATSVLDSLTVYPPAHCGG